MAKSSTATKSKPKARKAAAPKKSQDEVTMASPAQHLATATFDNSSVRGDNGALVGHFGEVVSGEHKGRYGVVDSVAKIDEKTGLPESVVFITRDQDTARLVVDYKDVRPAEAGRR